MHVAQGGGILFILFKKKWKQKEKNDNDDDDDGDDKVDKGEEEDGDWSCNGVYGHERPGLMWCGSNQKTYHSGRPSWHGLLKRVIMSYACHAMPCFSPSMPWMEMNGIDHKQGG